MVQIVRKASLPSPADLPEPLAQLAAQALATSLREPRPAGFPLLFTKQWQLIEPAVAFLHEHAIQRAHTADIHRGERVVEILLGNRAALGERPGVYLGGLLSTDHVVRLPFHMGLAAGFIVIVHTLPPHLYT